MRLLLMLIFLTGCLASTGPRKKCERINDSMKICRDMIHTEHCRIEIERNEPYPNTITEKFWCKDTGFLGYKLLKKEENE